MERIGEDEIFSIFEQIPNREDKNSFSKVCKKFLKVSCFYLRSLHTKSPDLLYDVLTSSPKMSCFECHVPLSNNSMKLIAESCHNIENLDLSFGEYIDPEGKLDFDDLGLCAIANACIHLDRVDLTGRLRCKEIGISSLVRSCKYLRELFLGNCVNVTDKSLKMIGEATCLRKLSLRGCYLISDLGLEYLANGDLKYCLQTLYLDKCDRITDNGIVHLKKLESLRTLGLSRCGVNITYYGVLAICELPYIEALYLKYLVNITDTSLIEIGHKCSNLSVICLEGCNRITGAGLRAFSGHLRLARLWLFSCYKFSWEDVTSIALTCPNLRYLGLSRRIKNPMPARRFLMFNDQRCQIKWG